MRRSDKALAPSGYLLGPGDELNIQVFGKDSIEAFVEVDRSGQITVPMIGAISLAGLTFEEAKRVIGASGEYPRYWQRSGHLIGQPCAKSRYF